MAKYSNYNVWKVLLFTYIMPLFCFIPHKYIIVVEDYANCSVFPFSWTVFERSELPFNHFWILHTKYVEWLFKSTSMWIQRDIRHTHLKQNNWKNKASVKNVSWKIGIHEPVNSPITSSLLRKLTDRLSYQLIGHLDISAITKSFSDGNA